MAQSEPKRGTDTAKIVSGCIQPFNVDLSLTPFIEYINNHTQPWGPFFDVNTCHSMVQASYCSTGQARIEAATVSSAGALRKRAAHPSEAQQGQVQVNEVPVLAKRRLREGHWNPDNDRLAQPLGAERKRKAGGENEDEDDRWSGKRPKCSREGTNIDVTREELGELSTCYAHSDLLMYEC